MLLSVKQRKTVSSQNMKNFLSQKCVQKKKIRPEVMCSIGRDYTMDIIYDYTEATYNTLLNSHLGRGRVRTPSISASSSFRSSSALSVPQKTN